MKKILGFAAALVLVSTLGCGSRGEEGDGWATYEAEDFVLKYPAYMNIAEERNGISDTIDIMQDGYSIYLWNDTVQFDIKIVKSAMPDWNISLAEWRDLSIFLKGADGRYLSVADTGTVRLNGMLMPMVAFYVAEGSDISKHYQFIAKNNGRLFYFNFRLHGVGEMLADSAAYARNFDRAVDILRGITLINHIDCPSCHAKSRYVRPDSIMYGDNDLTPFIWSCPSCAAKYILIYKIRYQDKENYVEYDSNSIKNGPIMKYAGIKGFIDLN